MWTVLRAIDGTSIGWHHALLVFCHSLRLEYSLWMEQQGCKTPGVYVRMCAGAQGHICTSYLHQGWCVRHPMLVCVCVCRWVSMSITRGLGCWHGGIKAAMAFDDDEWVIENSRTTSGPKQLSLKASWTSKLSPFLSLCSPLYSALLHQLSLPGRKTVCIVLIKPRASWGTQWSKEGEGR